MDESLIEKQNGNFANTVLPAVVGSQTKYQIIYADPAWEVMAGSKQSRKEGDSQKSLPLTYPTMKLEEIKALPIKAINYKYCG